MKEMKISNLKPTAYKHHPLDPRAQRVVVGFTFDIECGDTKEKFFVQNIWEIKDLQEIINRANKVLEKKEKE